MFDVQTDVMRIPFVEIARVPVLSPRDLHVFRCCHLVISELLERKITK